MGDLLGHFKVKTAVNCNLAPYRSMIGWCFLHIQWLTKLKKFKSTYPFPSWMYFVVLFCLFCFLLVSGSDCRWRILFVLEYLTMAPGNKSEKSVILSSVISNQTSFIHSFSQVNACTCVHSFLRFLSIYKELSVTRYIVLSGMCYVQVM